MKTHLPSSRILHASLIIIMATIISLPMQADYTVYPIPQHIIYQNNSSPLTKQVNIIVDEQIDEFTIARLKEVLTIENGITTIFSKKAVSRMSNIYLAVRGQQDKNVKHSKSTSIFSAKSEQYAINQIKREIDRLQAPNPAINIESILSKAGKFDRHIISISANKDGNADISIIGEHTNAVFFALATLEQILEQSNKNANGINLQNTLIADYADLEYRGIVEGYYGYPYSFDVKKDLMQFFKRYKMNTYLYGAKSDPYHSGYWRESYPEVLTAQQEKNGWLSCDMLKELSRLSQETKVNFIWAIHPNSGRAVDFHSLPATHQAVDDVMGKFEKMHKLGIRQFAVFLDDAGWDFNDVGNYRDFLSLLRDTLITKYNHHLANPADTVKPIHYVPHIYAINFASESGLKTYFDAISQTASDIVVYTTGTGVWSTLRNDDFITMQRYMNRPVALWWNYPCNDNKDGRIYTADMFSTLNEMGLATPDKAIPQCLGIVSNPMQQGTVAKICLFGVADYSWNNTSFDTQHNWAASFPAIIGKERAPLYHYIAKYLRYQDPATLEALINDYKAVFPNNTSASSAIKDTLRAINNAATSMLELQEQTYSDSLLLQDLKPWLLKLRDMSQTAIDLLCVAHNDNQQQRWLTYSSAIATLNRFKSDQQYMVEALEGMGENPPSELHRVEPSHKYLMPFLEWLKEHVYDLTSANNLQDKPTTPILLNAGNTQLANTRGYMQQDGAIFLESDKGVEIKPHEHVYIALPQACTIAQANISKIIFDNYNISTSLYGKHFDAVKNNDQLSKCKVKYFRLQNKSAKKATTLNLSKDNFCLATLAKPVVGNVTIPSGAIWERHTADLLADNNYSTFVCLNRSQQDGDRYTLSLTKAQPIYDVTVAIGLVNQDFPKVANIEVSLDSINWTPLQIDGAPGTTDLRMSLPQVQKLNEQVALCSFKADGSMARYVRLVVKEAFQERWLRLYEIDVNAQYTQAQFLPTACVGKLNIVEVADNKAYTSYTAKANNETLTYSIYSLCPSSQLTIYARANSANISASVSASDGTKTIVLGKINDGINHFDLKNLGNAHTITITGLSPAISIAEIIAK